jgi:sarcosine oxidase subunit gamma
VSDFTLTARSPLGGVKLDFDGITIAEVSDMAIVSIATPRGGEKALGKALASAYGTGLPVVGQSAKSKAGDARFLGLARDQAFMLFDEPGGNPLDAIAREIADAAYLTNQSDSWAMIRISGPKSRTALERICPLDLHPSAFPEGKVARTVMEHLGVIILHEALDRFLLMSARSYAGSFLHAVETSVRNII